MANLARKYYEELQDDDEGAQEGNTRQDSIQRALRHIPDEQCLEEPERTKMSQSIDERLVAKAIKIAKKGTMMGMDGCPYKLWKTLDERYQKPMRD